jgi:hypothetical protein
MDSVVSIAIQYGLDVPLIESRWRRDFPHPSRWILHPTQLPVQFGRDMALATHLHLAPRLRMTGVLYLLPIHAFMT